MTVLDWLVIGGGIHGVHIGAHLASALTKQNFKILDPGKALLDRWKHNTAATHMSCLRSTSIQHLDIHPMSLRRFERKQFSKQANSPPSYHPPYDRPSLPLFNAHCDLVLRKYDLCKRHLRASAVSINLSDSGVTVTTDCGSRIATKRIVLALGPGGPPAWPDWAPNNHSGVQHLFGPEQVETARDKEPVVVGGGISAAQIALELTSSASIVHLISRHPLRKHQFDSAPGWLGPKCMRKFEREKSWQKRYAMIEKARNRGSLPPRLRRQVQRAIQSGSIRFHQDSILRFVDFGEDFVLHLKEGKQILCTRIVLATGFSPQRPPLIEALVEQFDLPLAACGSPIVDKALRWHPRVFVTGELAELQLGPTSKNISGARRAGERIAGVLAKEHQLVSENLNKSFKPMEGSKYDSPSL